MTGDKSPEFLAGLAASLHEASRFEGPDAFYATLVKKLEAAGDEGALQFLCRLVLILANEIGRQDTLLAALGLAEKKPQSSNNL